MAIRKKRIDKGFPKGRRAGLRDPYSGLHMADTWYRGWRAYVDGKETKIYRANLGFRAV